MSRRTYVKSAWSERDCRYRLRRAQQQIYCRHRRHLSTIPESSINRRTADVLVQRRIKSLGMRPPSIKVASVG